jgi:ATP/maltotriose-dependent transcriptional regulator MalT
LTTANPDISALARQAKALLQTKLTLPRLHQNPVSRPRLLNQLNTAV